MQIPMRFLGDKSFSRKWILLRSSVLGEAHTDQCSSAKIDARALPLGVTPEVAQAMESH